MTRSLALVAFLALAPAMHSQIAPAGVSAIQTASLEQPNTLDLSASSSSTIRPDDLPDAPSANLSGSASRSSAVPDAADAGLPSPVAGKYDTVILPGQTAVPLHGMQKAVYGLHDAFNPLQLAGITLSAGWSQLIDSAPHYGTNGEAFGKREGVAALRSTIQTLATDAIFSPMFHDDPRYYELGDGHRFLNRVVYAATRVVITRSSHSTQQRINAPLLLGYASAAAMNNLYYPDRDTGGKETLKSWGGSLGGAALGFEVSEFLDDALKMVHLRKD
jgi:hypothetical protein